MILALASGKGGTGVTSLAIALGASLVELGIDTTLVDANLRVPNVGLHLGTSRVPVGTHELLRHPERVTESVHHHPPSGLKIVPGNIGAATKYIRHHDLLALPKIAPFLSTLVLLDCASGLHQETLASLAVSDGMIAVTTPELSSVISTLKLIKHAKELGTPVHGVIINHTGTKHAMPAANVHSLLGVPVLAEVPHDDAVAEAHAIKHPFTYSHPESPASLAVKQVAEHVYGTHVRPTPITP
jgi:MinD-like ATPase involved in chromosome partitioning or flagellar assembly